MNKYNTTFEYHDQIYIKSLELILQKVENAKKKIGCRLGTIIPSLFCVYYKYRLSISHLVHKL